MSGHHNVLHPAAVRRGRRARGRLRRRRGFAAQLPWARRPSRAKAWQDEQPAAQPKTIERFIAAVRDGGPTDPDFAHACELQQVIDMAFAADADGGVRPVA